MSDDRFSHDGTGAPEPVHIDDIPAGRAPRSLGELLGRYLGRTLGKDAPAANDIFAKWRSIVGDAIADNVTPVRLEAGTLTVEVTEPAWATQLRFLEQQVVTTLREHAGDVVDSIEVRVRRSR
jgi:predicted nucleic acid-binding Zn ribbon protein